MRPPALTNTLSGEPPAKHINVQTNNARKGRGGEFFICLILTLIGDFLGVFSPPATIQAWCAFFVAAIPHPLSLSLFLSCPSRLSVPSLFYPFRRSLRQSVSQSHSLSLCLSGCLSVSSSFSVSLPLSLSVLCLCISVSLFLCLSDSILLLYLVNSWYLFLCFYLSLSPSLLLLSLSLSPSVNIATPASCFGDRVQYCVHLLCF